MIGFLLALLVGALAVFRFAPVRGTRRQLEAIRAAGLPVSSAELDVWYKAVPAKENQALVIIEAAKLRVDPPKGADPTASRFGFLNGDKISPELQASVKAYLATNQPALQMLHQAAQLTESRYPIDLTLGPNTLLPNLAQLKGLVQLLRLEAAEQSLAGNVAAAVEALHTSFAVSRSLRMEPLLISDLVRIACVAITLNPLEWVLNDHPLTHEQLQLLSRDVADADETGPRALFRGLVGERAEGLSIYDLSFGQIEALSSSGGTMSSESALKNLGYNFYRVSGMQQRDLALYLEMTGGFVNSARLEFPEMLREADRIEAEMSARFSQGLGRLAVIARMLLPALSKAAQKEAALSARLRCAEIALAVERFRLDHGDKLPETTAQLAPDYLHKVPVDPFDGGAFAYDRLEGKGYRVISRGATKNGNAPSRAKNADDVQISVLR